MLSRFQMRVVVAIIATAIVVAGVIIWAHRSHPAPAATATVSFTVNDHNILHSYCIDGQVVPAETGGHEVLVANCSSEKETVDVFKSWVFTNGTDQHRVMHAVLSPNEALSVTIAKSTTPTQVMAMIRSKHGGYYPDNITLPLS